MSLKVKIADRLKAKAAGVNLSQKRIDAIVARAEKGLTDESDDAAIDANLDVINELTPFKEIAALDDHERAKARKAAEDKAKATKTDPTSADPANEPGDDVPSWAKTLIEANKSLVQTVEAIKGEKVANTRREQYLKALEGTSKTYQERELKKFDRMAFKSDDEFNEFLEEAKTFASDAVQEDTNSGLGVDRPAGGNGNPDSKNKVSDAEIDSLADAIL